MNCVKVIIILDELQYYTLVMLLRIAVHSTSLLPLEIGLNLILSNCDLIDSRVLSCALCAGVVSEDCYSVYSSYRYDTCTVGLSRIPSFGAVLGYLSTYTPCRKYHKGSNLETVLCQPPLHLQHFLSAWLPSL